LGRYRGEPQCPGRPAQPGQMLAEPEDPSARDAQALPHGVAALDCGVEWADAGLVAVAEPAAHVDDEVTVTFIEGLEHVFLPPVLPRHGQTARRADAPPPGGWRASSRSRAGSVRAAGRGGPEAGPLGGGTGGNRSSATRCRTSAAPTRRHCRGALAARRAWPRRTARQAQRTGRA